MSFLSFIKIIKQGANDLALKPSTSSLSLGFIHNAFQLLKSNVFNVDFLKCPENPQKWFRKYDMIIGNPPYNTSKMNIIQDDNWVEVEGKGCWGWFVKKAVQVHLKGRGYLLFITPSFIFTWLKYTSSLLKKYNELK